MPKTAGKDIICTCINPILFDTFFLYFKPVACVGLVGDPEDTFSDDAAHMVARF